MTVSLTISPWRLTSSLSSPPATSETWRRYGNSSFIFSANGRGDHIPHSLSFSLHIDPALSQTISCPLVCLDCQLPPTWILCCIHTMHVWSTHSHSQLVIHGSMVWFPSASLICVPELLFMMFWLFPLNPKLDAVTDVEPVPVLG